MEKEQCSNCRFWSNRDEYDGSVMAGLCRRYPPRIVEIWLPEDGDGNREINGDDDAAMFSQFPGSVSDNYCGEWQAAGSEMERVWSDQCISRLDLTVRARGCLFRAGIKTVGDLLSHTRLELLSFKDLGATVLAEIERKLSAQKLSLK